MIWTIKDIIILASGIGCVVMFVSIVISCLCDIYMNRKIDRETDKALLLIRYATTALKEVSKETIEESAELTKKMFEKDIEE